MRIDGAISSYPLDRSSRTGGAVTPYREVQRDAEESGKKPSAPSSTQGFEQEPLARKVQQGNASSDSLPVRARDLTTQERPLSKRISQALESYGTTARYASEQDDQQVLGLDLYA